MGSKEEPQVNGQFEWDGGFGVQFSVGIPFLGSTGIKIGVDDNGDRFISKTFSHIDPNKPYLTKNYEKLENFDGSRRVAPTNESVGLNTPFISGSHDPNTLKQELSGGIGYKELLDLGGFVTGDLGKFDFGMGYEFPGGPFKITDPSDWPMFSKSDLPKNLKGDIPNSRYDGKGDLEPSNQNPSVNQNGKSSLQQISYTPPDHSVGNNHPNTLPKTDRQGGNGGDTGPGNTHPNVQTHNPNGNPPTHPNVQTHNPSGNPPAHPNVQTHNPSRNPPTHPNDHFSNDRRHYGDDNPSPNPHNQSATPASDYRNPPPNQHVNYNYNSDGYNHPSPGNNRPNRPNNQRPSHHRDSRDHQDQDSNGRGYSNLTSPIILDLDGVGIKVTELGQSTRFVDATGDGLQHRMAWAGAGCGVLFFDANSDGLISSKREFVFTQWDPTARGDLEAIRSVFDTDHNGTLDVGDAEFAKFRVEKVLADGSTLVQTLAEAGITSINLTADATRIELPDGSVITGQTTFTRSNGGTPGTVANTMLAADAQGYAVTQTVTTDGAGGSGNRVVVSQCYDAQGALAYTITSVTSPSGANVTNSYDDTGDGVYDRLQTVTRAVNDNDRPDMTAAA